MGPVQLFVFLAAVSGAFGSDESLKLKPWIPDFQDALNSTDLPTLNSAEGNDFILKTVNESSENLGTIDPVRFIIGKNALDCGSHSLSPGQTVDIQSTNFPDNFPQNDACTWTFEASSPNSTIEIDCKPFKLKKCKYSSLEITGGNFNKIFCGNEEDGIQASSSNHQMEVVFKSRKITSQGFQCTVSASGTTQETRSCVQCGTVNRAARIVNGYSVYPHEFPWHAVLVKARTNTPFCGGALYNDRFVLTAAHCLVYIDDNGITAEVLLGAHDLFNPPSTLQRIGVKNKLKHYLYNSVTRDNDIAIIELATPAILNDFVKPACLPSSSQYLVGGYAVASGYGQTRFSYWTNIPYKALVAIQWNNYCQPQFMNPFILMTNNMICTAPVNLMMTCHTDSGGPLVIYNNGRWILVGLTSLGDPTCRNGYAGVFTRVSQYVDILADLPDSGQSNLCY